MGKEGRDWEAQGAHEYLKRLKGRFELSLHYLKGAGEFLRLAPDLSKVIFCDPIGEERDSVQFANLLQSQLERGQNRLTIAVGAAQGFGIDIPKGAVKISFSKMTFPHQLFRIMLLEQIYRADQILRGTPYHTS